MVMCVEGSDLGENCEGGDLGGDVCEGGDFSGDGDGDINGGSRFSSSVASFFL